MHAVAECSEYCHALLCLQQSSSKQDGPAGLELVLPQEFDVPHRGPRRGQDLKLSLRLCSLLAL